MSALAGCLRANKAYSAAFSAYQLHVQGAGGTINNAAATNQGLTLAATMPSLVQWLDARFGFGAGWYSLVNATDAGHTVYSATSAALVTDSTRNGLIIEGGSWDGGRTLTLDLADAYTWVFRYYLPANGDGYLWGDRYNSIPGGQADGWNWMSSYAWRNYNYSRDAYTDSFTLPRGQWGALILRKQATTDNQTSLVTCEWRPDTPTNTGAFTTLFTIPVYVPFGELSFGIAGSTDGQGQWPASALLRYQTMIRASSYLTNQQIVALLGI